MKTLYQSEILNKIFESEEELKTAEKEYQLAKAEKELAATEKRNDAKKVEDKMAALKKAEDEYNEELQAFCKKHKTAFRTSLTPDKLPSLSHRFNMFNDFFDMFPRFHFGI